jgi:hypothetical protein
MEKTKKYSINRSKVSRYTVTFESNSAMVVENIDFTADNITESKNLAEGLALAQ